MVSRAGFFFYKSSSMVPFWARDFDTLKALVAGSYHVQLCIPTLEVFVYCHIQHVVSAEDVCRFPANKIAYFI